MGRWSIQFTVSIRAPRTRAGRQKVFRAMGNKFMFQSAPRAPARGDKEMDAESPVNDCFNPRPAHPRGATTCRTAGRPWLKLFQSAPRAPARGDDIYRDIYRTADMFQSAPRAPARGD